MDVILRDGSTLRLRAPARGDAGALVTFFGRLSEHSRYLRFHGVRHVDASFADHFVEPDWVDRGALVGVQSDDDGGDRVVALAEYARLRDPLAAEVAFAVADACQGHGIGSALTRRIVDHARRNGMTVLRATTLAENRPALKLLRRLGFAVRAADAAGIDLELVLDGAGAGHADARAA